eukprot:1157153-Pelagomonas_calceolata.AAC.12
MGIWRVAHHTPGGPDSPSPVLCLNYHSSSNIMAFSVGGVIHNPHTLEPLEELGLDTCNTTKLALKLHACSVPYAYKLTRLDALLKGFFQLLQTRSGTGYC